MELKPRLYRQSRTKIVATLGPTSSSLDMIRRLFDAGADAFRLNFSHGTAQDHRDRVQAIRQLESEVGYPIGIIADLQGPKLRIGLIEGETITLQQGYPLRLELHLERGDARRVPLPHPEIFSALKPGHVLLLDDGKVRLRVGACGSDYAETIVEAGNHLSSHKGVNLPQVVLPLSPLTEKDQADLKTALELGVDWIALSFVQRPEDVAQARALVGPYAALIAKIEKPSAVECLDEILKLADGVMVARGDLGVETPAEEVPRTQKRILRQARRAGKPVIVATQMMESMISSPTPTRAEASDVAAAVYDGADAVMLSAETASGAYPVEATQMMDKIIQHTQADVFEYGGLLIEHPDLQHTASDAITAAARQVAETVGAKAIVTYTTSGATTLRAARERPPVPILGLTPDLKIARRLGLSYGVYPIQTDEAVDFSTMARWAVNLALRDQVAQKGDLLVVTAGVPFGKTGTTNTLRIVEVEEKQGK